MSGVSPEIMKRLGLKPADLRDPYLRKFQATYDDIALHPVEYPMEAAGYDKRDSELDHIREHIGKAGLKLARLIKASPLDCEQEENIVRREVFPEALITRTRLANLLHVDLAKMLNKLPVATSIPERALGDAQTELAIVGGCIDAYIEPLQEGRMLTGMRRQLKEEGIPAAHRAAMLLGAYFGEEPMEAHVNRLQVLLARRSAIV